MKIFPPPSETQRLEARLRTAARPVMYQHWRNLLFLHWEYSTELIQNTLPAGLFVDTFGGKAFLGIVPFFMQRVRPRFLPPLPGISDFMELNLRTYVYDRSGVPGVWFYSLDANQALAVAIARTVFNLPYHHAKMTSTMTASGAIRYQSWRTKNDKPSDGCVFEYKLGLKLPDARADSLEFFLVERYRLYAGSGSRLCRGAVFHEPYPLFKPELSAWNEELSRLNGFSPTGRPPDHAVMSPGVDVSIMPLQRMVGPKNYTKYANILV